MTHKRQKFKELSLLLVLVYFLSGCSTLNQLSKELANNVSYKNPVTGARDLGFMSEEEEIKAGEDAENYYIQQFQKRGELIDADPSLLKLNNMMARIIEVSHRPNLPWKIHFVNTESMNAFALPGGRIFVLQGIFGNLVVNEDELAGVIAHEIAHVTCRHQVKSEAWNFIMPMIQKRVKKEIYQASYTTIQEDEADRVGLLYMALAGYNPEAVYNVWARAHIKLGSDPGNYTYDHSLNIDRANKVAQLIPIAKRYYVGEGIKNPNYSELLMNNDLITRNNIQDENGLLAILSLGLNTYSQYMTTTIEEKNREYTKAADQNYSTEVSKMNGYVPANERAVSVINRNLNNSAKTESIQQVQMVQDKKYGHIPNNYFVYINSNIDSSKTAQINLAKVFGSYNKTKEYDRILQDEASIYKNKREIMVTEIKQIGDSADREMKIKSLKEFDEQNQSSLRQEQGVKMKEILRDIEKATAEFGDKNQYKAIYNSRMPNCNEKEDVSNEIAALLNNPHKENTRGLYEKSFPESRHH